MLPTLLLVVVADHAFYESSGNAIIASDHGTQIIKSESRIHYMVRRINFEAGNSPRA
jgi:hypothetical protein